MVLNPEPLDWESSTITTRPLEKVLGKSFEFSQGKRANLTEEGVLERCLSS